MQPSKLKLYIEIAKTLSKHGSLSIHELASFLKIDPCSLSQPVKFFSDQRIIREKKSNTVVTFVLTKRGAELLKFFNVQPLVKVTISKN